MPDLFLQQSVALLQLLGALVGGLDIKLPLELAASHASQQALQLSHPAGLQSQLVLQRLQEHTRGTKRSTGK